MRKRWALLASVLAVVAVPAHGATKLAGAPTVDAHAVRYAPAPSWVLPPPPPTATTTPAGAPVRIIYADQQIRLGAQQNQLYSAYRLKILSPEALSVGNIGVQWNPGFEQVTVHYLRVYRDGRPIDVLASQKFDVIQRENRLEAAMLDGVLTATLQAAGLQVGDEIEFAVTIDHRELNLGSNSYGFAQLPIMGTLGSHRVFATWPAALPVKWSETDDLPKVAPVPHGSENSLTLQLNDPDTVVSPDGAPARYTVHRLVQYTTFASWPSLSTQVSTLFERATALSPTSPIRAEATRLAAASSDPAARALAALQLVEDRIRYVYVGLNGANYRPATADETWERRFGDCKAKTVVLVALLRAMGIAAEPVLVASNGGDGMDQRLPTPLVFDHVLVRATIAGAPHWLDATRIGDRSLDAVFPTFRWGLPLRAAGAALEPVKPAPPAQPLHVVATDIDASAGFDAPARLTITQVFRGDQATLMRLKLSSVATADADRLLRTFWTREQSSLDVDKVAWKTADDGALVLTMSGTDKQDWSGDAKDGRSLNVAGAGFTPPSTMKRPKEQSQDAPWAIDFPLFSCWSTTIHLPPPGKGRHWSYRAASVDRRFGGVEYWREALLDHDVLHTVMSKRADAPEIPAAEAARVNATVKDFDNNMSQVFEAKQAAAVNPSGRFLSAPIDWTKADAQCLAPSQRPVTASASAAATTTG